MFNLITSNIRFDNPSDGNHTWDNRKNFLSQLLLGFSPFLIATQEGRGLQLKELEKLLGCYKIVEEHREWIKERMYPCLYINKETQVEDSGDIWLSKTPHIPGSSSFDSTFPRLCTWVKTQIKNKTLIIANLHLDHVDDKTRYDQIKVFCQEFKKIITDGDNYIVCGDFNSNPGSDVNKLLISEFKLIDPWIALGQKEESSHHQFLGKLESGSRIDWILHSSGLECLSIKMIKDNQNGVYPSDHFPICATFKF